MKILVDELPKLPNECIFARFFDDLNIYYCSIDNNQRTCDVDSDNCKCPHLKLFEATATKYHGDGYSITGVTKIPVYLD